MTNPFKKFWAALQERYGVRPSYNPVIITADQLEELQTMLPAIKEALDRCATLKPELGKSARDLVREILGVQKLADYKPPRELTEAEKKGKDGTYSGLFVQYLKEDLRALMQNQIEWQARTTVNWEENILSRGTLNGLDLVYQLFEEAHNRHMANLRPPEPFDPHSPIPETEVSPFKLGNDNSQ